MSKWKIVQKPYSDSISSVQICDLVFFYGLHMSTSDIFNLIVSINTFKYKDDHNQSRCPPFEILNLSGLVFLDKYVQLSHRLYFSLTVIFKMRFFLLLMCDTELFVFFNTIGWRWHPLIYDTVHAISYCLLRSLYNDTRRA